MDPKFARNSILKKSTVEESTPTVTFSRNRRISFSGKKSVKEFLPGDDKATIWGTSYEESAEGLQLQQTISESRSHENELYSSMKSEYINTNLTNSNKIKATIWGTSYEESAEGLQLQQTISESRNHENELYSSMKSEYINTNLTNSNKIKRRNTVIIPVNDKENIYIKTNEIIDIKEKWTDTSNVDNIINEDIHNFFTDNGTISSDTNCSMNITLNAPEVLYLKKKEKQDRVQLQIDHNDPSFCSSITFFGNELENVKKKNYNLDITLKDIKDNNGITYDNISHDLEYEELFYNNKFKNKNREYLCSVNDDMYENINENNNLKLSTITSYKRSTNKLESLNFSNNQEEAMTDCINIKTRKLNCTELIDKNSESKHNSNIEYRKSVILNTDLQESLNHKKDPKQQKWSQKYYNNRESSPRLDETLMKLPLNRHQIISGEKDLVSNPRSQTIFDTAESSNIIDIQPNTSKALSIEEYQKFASKKRQAIIFQTTIPKAANNMELSTSPDSNIPVVQQHEMRTIKQNEKNRQTINFQTSKCNNNNMQLSFISDNTIINEGTEKNMLQHFNPKNRQTINLQSDKGANKNEMELSLASDKIISAQELEKVGLKSRNQKNRQTNNFQTTGCNDDDHMELSINPDNNIPVVQQHEMTTIKQNEKNRHTIIFQTDKCADKNEMELSLASDKIISEQELKKVGLKTRNQKNRQTINFQTTGCNDADHMKLSINPDNNIPMVQQHEMIQQNEKNRHTINFQTSKCNGNNMQLSFADNEMINEGKETNILKLSNLKNGQTINFQSDVCGNENEMELSVIPDNIISAKDGEKLGSNTQNQMNRQTSIYIDEDDKELSFKRDNKMLAEEHQRLVPKNKTVKVRQTINFQTPECSDKNDMEMSAHSNKILSTEELQTLNSEIPNTESRHTNTERNNENNIERSLNPNLILLEERNNLGRSNNCQTFNFQTANFNDENKMELSSNSDTMPVVKRQTYITNKPNVKSRQTVNFQTTASNNADHREPSLNPDTNMQVPAIQHEEVISIKENERNRRTINFQTDVCAHKNEMELSLTPDQIMLAEQFQTKNQFPRNRKTINFRNTGCNDADNMEFSLNPDNNMPAVQHQEVTSIKENERNRQTINFQTDVCADKNEMELSLTPDQIMLAEQFQRKNQFPRNRKTINFRNTGCNDADNMEFSLKPDNNMPAVQHHEVTSIKENERNRQTINFQTDVCADKNEMELSLTPDQIMLAEQFQTKNQFPRNRKTINFRNTGCNDADNMEFSLKPDNNMPAVQHQEVTSIKENERNRQTINFQTDVCADKNEMELSLTPDQIILAEQFQTKNQFPRNRKTINFRNTGCNDADNMEFSLNPDNNMPAVQHQEVTSIKENGRNRQTINFQTDICADKNEMELSLTPDQIMLAEQFQTKNQFPRNRKTINFRNTGCNDADNMEFSLKPDNNMPAVQHQEVTSIKENERNRQTINFQTDVCADKNEMELSLTPDQIILAEQFQTKNQFPRNRKTINFRNTGCNDADNMEFSLNPDNNMPAVQRQEVTSIKENGRNRQTINFQTDVCADKNEMEVSLTPDQIMLAEQFQTKSQFPRNRKTINFQSSARNDVNNIELSICHDSNIPVVQQHVMTTIKQTINFQSDACGNENEMELSVISDNIISAKEGEKLVSNFQTASFNDENNMELSLNTDTMPVVKQQTYISNKANVKGRQTINFQTTGSNDADQMESSLNPEQYEVTSIKQDEKDRQTINFQTDENEMELSLTPDQIMLAEQLQTKNPCLRNRETINFQAIGRNNQDFMELSLNTCTIPVVNQTFTCNKPNSSADKISLTENQILKDTKNHNIIKYSNLNSHHNIELWNRQKEHGSENKSPKKQIFASTDCNISSKKILDTEDSIKISQNKINENIDIDKFLNCSLYEENNCSCSSTIYSDALLKEQRKYIDLRLSNSGEIDKIHLSLVSSLEDDDINLKNMSQSDSISYKRDVNLYINIQPDNNKALDKIEIPNKRSISTVCKKCKTNLNDTDLKSFVVEDIPEKYEDIDWSGLDRFKNVPTISDVFNAAMKLREYKQSLSFSNKEDSVVFPETPKISFLLENLGAEYMENYEKMICYTPIFPLAVSFEYLIENKYKNENHPWRMKNFSGNNIMIFCHHKNKTFNIIFKLYSQKNYTDIVRFEKVLIRKSQIQRKWSTIERIQYNELMRKLQYDLTNMYPNSTDFNKCLEEVDRICCLANESINHLLTSVALTKSILESDNRNIFVKQICRIKELGQLTKCHEFHIKLGYVDQLSYRDIIFPSKSLFNKSIQELPVGIDFLNVFLSDPISFLKDRLYF